MSQEITREPTEPPDTEASRFQFIVGIVVLFFVGAALFVGPYYVNASAAKNLKPSPFADQKVPVSTSR